jgi:putative endonuclease
LSNPAQELGKWGEKLAADFLIKLGYAIIARNVRTPYGEIDLIAQQPDESNLDGTTIVFVEVKTRSTQSYGFPEESITASKQEHLISAALHYLQGHPEFDQDWRIDVIAIERYENLDPIIHHFENALQE